MLGASRIVQCGARDLTFIMEEIFMRGLSKKGESQVSVETSRSMEISMRETLITTFEKVKGSISIFRLVSDIKGASKTTTNMAMEFLLSHMGTLMKETG